jgi:hypothetical protein
MLAELRFVSISELKILKSLQTDDENLLHAKADDSKIRIYNLGKETKCQGDILSSRGQVKKLQGSG